MLSSAGHSLCSSINIVLQSSCLNLARGLEEGSGIYQAPAVYKGLSSRVLGSR
jgi:hypothetical protein